MHEVEARGLFTFCVLCVVTKQTRIRNFVALSSYTLLATFQHQRG